MNNRLELPPPPTYGAVELKEFIRKYTWQGFLATLALLIIIIFLYWGLSKVTEREAIELPVAPLSKIVLDAPPPAQDDFDDPEAPPPPAQQVIEYATMARAGMPVPVPDADIKADLRDFATFDQLDQSLAADEGQIVDIRDLPTDYSFGDGKREIVIDKTDDIPDMYEFIPVEKEPQVDLVELQKNILYPEVARRAGIEGRVVVRVFVDRQGKVQKSVVEQTDSQMLNQAALDAVRKTVFTPAIQNNQPIGCWVSIPISFRLR